MEVSRLEVTDCMLIIIVGTCLDFSKRFKPLIKARGAQKDLCRFEFL